MIQWMMFFRTFNVNHLRKRWHVHILRSWCNEPAFIGYLLYFMYLRKWNIRCYCLWSFYFINNKVNYSCFEVYFLHRFFSTLVFRDECRIIPPDCEGYALRITLKNTFETKFKYNYVFMRSLLYLYSYMLRDEREMLCKRKLLLQKLLRISST